MIRWALVLAVGVLTQISLAQLSMAEGPAVPAGSVAVAPAASEGAQASATQTTPSMMMGGLMPMVIMFAALYFLMIRPQNKKVKEQKTMIESLKHGDEVVTSSGMLGTISGIAEKVVTLEVAANVKIKILKSQIAQVVKDQIKELA